MLQVIAGFNRVRMLTPDLAIIAEAMRGSSITEVSATGLALRCREGALRWVLPRDERDASVQQSPAVTPGVAAAAAGIASAEPFKPAAASKDAAAAPAPEAGYAAAPAVALADKQAEAAVPVAAGFGDAAADANAAAKPQQAAAAQPPLLPQPAAPRTPIPAVAAVRKADEELQEDDMFQLDEVPSGCPAPPAALRDWPSSAQP